MKSINFVFLISASQPIFQTRIHRPGFTNNGKGYGAGFYEVKEDGVPAKLPRDVQGLHCGGG